MALESDRVSNPSSNTSYLSSLAPFLSLDFFICKIRVIVSTLQVYCKDEMRDFISVNKCLLSTSVT